MDSRRQQAYLKSIYAHSGLYMITPKSEYSTTNKMQVKIGIAGDFHDRFDTIQAARLERSIHRYLAAKYKFMVTKHSHSEETMLLTLKEITVLIATIEANIGLKFDKGDDKVAGKDQAGESMFPYIKILPGIFLDENLARGGTRVKAFSELVKNFIDSNYTNQAIITSAKKKKYKSFTMPPKGIKIPIMAALPEYDEEDD